MKWRIGWAMLVSGLILLVGSLTTSPHQHRLGNCRIVALPRTVACADGHMYIVHNRYMQDIGPMSPVPAIPKS